MPAIANPSAIAEKKSGVRPVRVARRSARTDVAMAIPTLAPTRYGLCVMWTLS